MILVIDRSQTEPPVLTGSTVDITTKRGEGHRENDTQGVRERETERKKERKKKREMIQKGNKREDIESERSRFIKRESG